MYQLAMVLSRIPIIVLLLIFIQDVTRIEGSSGNKDYIGENIISGSGQSTFSNESTNDMRSMTVIVIHTETILMVVFFMNLATLLIMDLLI